MSFFRNPNSIPSIKEEKHTEFEVYTKSTDNKHKISFTHHNLKHQKQLKAMTKFNRLQ